MVTCRARTFSLAVCALAALLLSGCQSIRDYIAQINQHSWTAYHESRWQAVVDACATGGAYIQPEQPTAPRLCAKLEPHYRELAEGWAASQLELRDLAAQRTVEEEYLAQLLDVLETRDRERLAGLVEQLPLYERRLTDAQSRLADSLGAQQEGVEKLKQAWEELWPAAEGQSLDFNLADGVKHARQTSPALDKAREAELREYHRQHYARLAMIYLDYAPGFTPLPADQVPAPPGCEELQDALVQYEQGLRLRYDINEAIEADLTRLAELAGFDPAMQPWVALALPQKGWQRQRTEAALARLKLLGRADALLTGCLDFQQAWLSEAWQHAWPGCPLENNLFAFAGISNAQLEPEVMEGWQELTFRK